MPHRKSVSRTEITFAQAQVVNGVEDIRLAASVRACKRIRAFRETKFSFAVILEIEKGQSL